MLLEQEMTRYTNKAEVLQVLQKQFIPRIQNILKASGRNNISFSHYLKFNSCSLRKREAISLPIELWSYIIQFIPMSIKKGNMLTCHGFEHFSFAILSSQLPHELYPKAKVTFSLALRDAVKYRALGVRVIV